jgi:hypothetical protein
MDIDKLVQKGAWIELINALPLQDRIPALFFIKEFASRQDFWKCFEIVWSTTKDFRNPKFVYLCRRMHGTMENLQFMKEAQKRLFAFSTTLSI